MFTEDDLLPLSGLQHLAFCERQWALIHLEQQWVENRLTAEGRQLHERADQPAAESRGDVRIARGVLLRSLRLGLFGRADVIEFHAQPGGATASPSEARPSGSASPGSGAQSGVCRWEALPDGRASDGMAPMAGQSATRDPRSAIAPRPYPVEYKRGRPKPDHCDEVQLCAQALCLEEMLGVAVAQGAIFYGTPRRRVEVEFDAALRAETEALAARMHEMFRAGRTPPPVYAPKCDNCSLAAICLPKGAARKASRYLRSSAATASEEPQG